MGARARGRMVIVDGWFDDGLAPQPARFGRWVRHTALIHVTTTIKLRQDITNSADRACCRHYYALSCRIAQYQGMASQGWRRGSNAVSPALANYLYPCCVAFPACERLPREVWVRLRHLAPIGVQPFSHKPDAVGVYSTFPHHVH